MATVKFCFTVGLFVWASAVQAQPLIVYVDGPSPSPAFIARSVAALNNKAGTTFSLQAVVVKKFASDEPQALMADLKATKPVGVAAVAILENTPRFGGMAVLCVPDGVAIVLGKKRKRRQSWMFQHELAHLAGAQHAEAPGEHLMNRVLPSISKTPVHQVPILEVNKQEIKECYGRRGY